MERIIEAPELATFRRRCDLIIDARSPAEFAEDHIDGAINVPMLDDAQRAEVGALYRENPFGARKLGAAYALDAIKAFLQSEYVAGSTKKTAMMIYCARGGQRSGAIASVLDQIGYSIFRLARGYKTYRTWVLKMLEEPFPGPVFVLYGYTGSWKTEVLHALAGSVNVLDLEGCARHRGSLLGDIPGRPQPTQRGFETALVTQIEGFSAGKPTLLEGESRTIGAITITEGVWRRLRAAVPIWLEVPRAARVTHILAGYGEYKDPALMGERLERLARYLAKKTLADMRADLEARDWAGLVDKLLEHHYDPLYRRARGRTEKHLTAHSLEEATAVVGSLLGAGQHTS